MTSYLRKFAFAATLALAAGGAALAPTSASAHGFGGHGGGHFGGHGHWGGGGWGFGGVRYVYGGCYLKRYVNYYGEIVVRRVCW